MPQAFPAELKEKVKMLAVQIGIREAARQCQIPEATVQAWSAREGWMLQKQQVQQVKDIICESKGLQPLATKSVSEVILSVGDKSKLILGKTVCKTAKQLHKSKGDSLITQTQALKATVDAGAKLFGWGSEAQSSPLVNINLLSAQLPEVPRAEGPVG